jgi:hypothetical protein
MNLKNGFCCSMHKEYNVLTISNSRKAIPFISLMSLEIPKSIDISFQSFSMLVVIQWRFFVGLILF